jgi:N6-L-threonylcarbamoyladenine synthase
VKPIVILAIESSCDDTSVGIVSNGILLANVTYGQKVHERYGGVVPEEASRAHVQNILPVINAALDTAKITLQDLSAIAVTQSPGLLGSLMVGFGVAKSLAQALEIPFITVNHMQAHVLSNLVEEPKPSFPFLCLTVSGGHTQIVQCDSALQTKVLGTTIDDAAGEAFDKVAKMLGLPYPGGPLVDKYAQLGDAQKFTFAKPQIPELNFSFSGLKTSVLYFLQKQKQLDAEFVAKNLNDICASVQKTIIEILIAKLKKAIAATGITEIAVAGGVSANSGLRAALIDLGKQMKCNVYIPQMQFCTDNGAMIAITAYHKFLAGEFDTLESVASARTM